MKSKNMYNISNRLSRNPFVDSQARMYSEDQTISEFYPTSMFWNIFNPQNEIYLGTRGSGKTIIMRMASYNLLRKMKNNRAEKIVKDLEYICFFVPLNLEFATSLVNDVLNNEYFTFSVNCLALEAFIETVGLVFDDIFIEKEKRIEADIKLTDEISKELALGSDCLMLKDLRSEIARLYNITEPWIDGETRNIGHIYYKEFLTPILRIINIITRNYGELFTKTTWLACIDEAEFLSEAHLKCVNTFMRTTKKNLALKMTTLPTKHTTKETTIKNIYIDDNGNDFNYRLLDYDCSSGEYESLTNHLIKYRFMRDSDLDIDSLEGLLGRCGRNDDLQDYFIEALNMPEKEAKKIIQESIIECLSEKRKLRYQQVKSNKRKSASQYFEKFAPAYYLRHAKKENSNANKTFEWFVGSKTIRKVSDGNPRRFINLMNYIVNEMIDKTITKKELHKLVAQFSLKEQLRSQSLPEHGFLLRALCEQIGTLLSTKIHGKVLYDYGCNFYIDKVLLNDDRIMEAIKLGIDYNHIKFAKNKFSIITNETHLRLSFCHAVNHWLPMRIVDSPTPTIRPQQLIIQFDDIYFNDTNSKSFLESYALGLKNEE